MTNKPIATITYNTDEHLKRVLDDLVSGGQILRYYAIKHDKDVDVESGEIKKTHWHIWLEPNGSRDLAKLAKEFIEVDPNNIKPLKCQPFQKSDLRHWLRYTKHDKKYLELKQLDNDGREEYQLSDYVCSDPDMLDDDWKTSAEVVKLSKKQQLPYLVDHIEQTKGFTDYTDVYKYAVAENMLEGVSGYVSVLRQIITDHNQRYRMDLEHDRLYDQMVIANQEIADNKKTIETLATENMKLRGIGNEDDYKKQKEVVFDE